MKLLEYMTFQNVPSRMFTRDWEIGEGCLPIRYREFGHDTNKLGQMIYILSSTEFMYDSRGCLVGKRTGLDGHPPAEISLEPGLELSDPAGRYTVSSGDASAFPWNMLVDIETLEGGCRIRSTRTGLTDGSEERQDVAVIRHVDRMELRFGDRDRQEAGIWRAIPGMPTVFEKRVSESLIVSAAATQPFDYGLLDYYTTILTFIFLI